MSVRTDVADVIRAGVPDDWKVWPYGVVPDRAYPPVVTVQQTTVTPRQRFGQRSVALLVTLMVEPGDTPEKSEDGLEAALDILLLASDALYGAVSAAERTTVQEKFNAYQITVEVTGELETD